MKVETALCDVAGCGTLGEQYEVKFPDGMLRADLCASHAAPLLQVREVLPKALFTKPGARRKAVRIVVDPNAAD